MKKLIPLCLSVLLLVGLTACSGSSEENRATTASSGNESAAQESAGAGESNAAVIYFSATGNTEQVAQALADKTGAALFEIEPEEPYTDADLDYNNDSCRANQEQNDPNARPAIAGDALDLSGKTIAPFCTSGGSGISQSLSTLEALEPDATITDGLRTSPASAGSDLDSWLETIA